MANNKKVLAEVNTYERNIEKTNILSQYGENIFVSEVPFFRGYSYVVGKELNDDAVMASYFLKEEEFHIEKMAFSLRREEAIKWAEKNKKDLPEWAK